MNTDISGAEFPLAIEKVLYVKHKEKSRDHHGKLHSHGLKFCELIYVDYGQMSIMLNNNDITVSTGECLFIKGGSSHSFSGVKGAPFDYLNIAFRAKLPDNIFNKSIVVSREGLILLDKMKQESLSIMPYSDEILHCFMTEFIIYSFRQIEFSTPHKKSGHENSLQYHSAITQKVMKIIENEFSKPLDLKIISKAVGISSAYLCFLIKKETGRNFTDILHQHRISVAKHLLRESALSLEEIAEAVGYQSLSFFFRIFKRKTGMTPKSYAFSLGDPTNKE